MGPRPAHPRASIRIVDVARIAGVSPQTVSNVVNERGGFTDATRLRVLAAIAETGYWPNRAARQLRTNRTRQIGFGIEGKSVDVRNPFRLSFLRAVVDAARPSGDRVVVFSSDQGDPGTLEHWARTREVDGFVFCNVTPGDPRTAMLAALDVPYAVMGRTSPGEPQTWVDIDNRAAMATLVDHLIARGNRTFAYVGYDGAEHWVVERREGVLDSLRRHGVHLTQGQALCGPYESLVYDLDALLGLPERPRCIITASDSLAMLVTSRARAHGLTVGAHLEIAGFDGGLLPHIIDAPLTRVRIPVERAAEAVVARLLREIDHGPTQEPGEYVDTELIVGRTA